MECFCFVRILPVACEFFTRANKALCGVRPWATYCLFLLLPPGLVPGPVAPWLLLDQLGPCALCTPAWRALCAGLWGHTPLLPPFGEGTHPVTGL